MNGLLAVIAAYLLGGIPFGYLIGRWKTGQDVRTMGSGNIGATNVLRTSGRAAGLLTLALDILKGYVAVWLASWLTSGSTLWMSAAALAVVVGHAFPVFLKFKGGKAVASFVGAFLYLTPVALFATMLVFAAVVAVTRFVSLGSVLGAALFPFAVWMILHPPSPVMLAAVFGGIFIIWRHHSNIRRLLAGNEHVLNLGGRK